MRKWRIATIGPTELFMHPSVIVCALYTFAIGHGVFFLTAILSILIHETAHALAATVLGSPPQTLELTPAGAVMRLYDERSMHPFRRGVMVMSGPLATLGLCILSLWHISGVLLPDEVRRMLLLSNMAILTMNLLPVLPLDGGRLAALLLENIISRKATDRVMRWWGSIVGAGLILLNLWYSAARGGWNLSLAISGCCILYCAQSCTLSQALEELRSLMDRKIMLENKRMVRTSTLTVLSTVTLREIVRKLPRRRLIEVCCLQPGSQRMIARFTEPEVIELYLASPGAQIGNCTKREANIE